MIDLHERTIAPSATSEAIAGALNVWLHDEYISSTHDRNRYLDDIERGRSSILLELNDPENFPAAKHYSHENRQRLWGQGYALDPENDFATARQLFNITMGMSGFYKRICFLKTGDETSYLSVKLGDNPSGIDLTELVDARLRYHFGGEPTQEDLAKPVVNMHTLLANTAIAFKLAEQGLKFIHERAPGDFDLGNSESLAMLEMCQGIWSEVAVDSILFAAANRDGVLSSVPFLEAKSISDEPGVIYPL